MRQKSRGHRSHRIGIFLVHRAVCIPPNACKWYESNPLREADLGQFFRILQCLQLLGNHSIPRLASPCKHVVVHGVRRFIIFQLAQRMGRSHHDTNFGVYERVLQLRNGLRRMHLPQGSGRRLAHLRLRILQGILRQFTCPRSVSKQAESSNAVGPLGRYFGQCGGDQHVPCLMFRTLDVSGSLTQG